MDPGEPHVELVTAPTRPIRNPTSWRGWPWPAGTSRDVACRLAHPGVDENNRKDAEAGCDGSLKALGAVDALNDRTESSGEGFAEPRMARGGSSSARRAAPETMMSVWFALVSGSAHGRGSVVFCAQVVISLFIVTV